MLLALDTSSRIVGIALYDGAQVLSEIIWGSQDYHTVELAPAVNEIFRRAKVDIDDLSALAVALGPGSFTGLRIGLALAKGLSLARHLPVIGIPSLDILAAAQPVDEKLLAAVIRAGRGRLAVGWYQPSTKGWKAGGKIEVMTFDSLVGRIERPTRVCGELTGEERRILGRKRKEVLLATPAQSARRPSFLAELAWQRWQAGQVSDPTTLAPIYVHYSDASLG